MNKTHFRRVDYRIESLRITIQGLQNSITELRKKADQLDWYDGIWLIEESEFIYGLVFVAIQNYINSSIYDRFENLKNQYFKYKLGEEINNSGRTDIELIISIANYFKHRDHPKDLIGETPKILKDFKLQFDKDVKIENSPILKGLDIFSENWELKILIQKIENWRTKLWTEE